MTPSEIPAIWGAESLGGLLDMAGAGVSDDSAGAGASVGVTIDVDLGVEKGPVTDGEVLPVDDAKVGAAVGTTNPPVPDGMMSVATMVSWVAGAALGTPEHRL